MFHPSHGRSASLARSSRSRRKSVGAAAFLCVAGIAAAALGSRLPGADDGADAALLAAGPALEAGAVARGETELFVEGLQGARALRAEVEALREELAAARLALAEAEARADRLAEAQIVVARLPELAPQFLAVPILGPGPDPRRRMLWVGGAAAGLTAGQAVLGPNGVLGQVLEVHGQHALVQLSTDSASRWGAEAVGEGGVSSDAGVVHGTGDALEFAPETTAARMAPGDLVVTSGGRGSLAIPGLLLGRVREVRVTKEGERRALLDPPDSAERLRQVYVLTLKPNGWEFAK